MRIGFLLCFFVLGGKAFSQCCSPGSPIGGTTNVGILDKGKLRSISFFKYSHSDTYLEGNEKSNFNFLKNASYNFIGTSLAYGVTNKITLETELGYFISKVQVYNLNPAVSLKGWGLSNGVVSGKYNLRKNTSKQTELTAGIGIKFPFATKPQIVNNVELPQDIQSSTGAFGGVAHLFWYKGFIEKGVRLFFINRFETNTENQREYKFGNALYSAFFVSKSFNLHLTGIIQARYEYKGKDFRNNYLLNSSGSHILYLSPQLNYTIAQKWNVSVLTDLPVYRYYNGIQLAHKFAFAINLMRDIS